MICVALFNECLSLTHLRYATFINMPSVVTKRCLDVWCSRKNSKWLAQGCELKAQIHDGEHVAEFVTYIF